MSREQDIDAVQPLTDPASGLSGIRPDAAELTPPVSPFTTAAHRLAHETATDGRALRQMAAERAEQDARRPPRR